MMKLAVFTKVFYMQLEALKPEVALVLITCNFQSYLVTVPLQATILYLHNNCVQIASAFSHSSCSNYTHIHAYILVETASHLRIVIVQTATPIPTITVQIATLTTVII